MRFIAGYRDPETATVRKPEDNVRGISKMQANSNNKMPAIGIARRP